MVLDWKWGHRSWEDWISKGKMMENVRRTGTRGYKTACHLPTMLHVLWFVHTYGQFDLQILVRARLGHSHLVELWLLGTVRSWVEDDLHSDIRKANTAGLSRSWIFDLGSCSICRSWQLAFIWQFLKRERETEQGFAPHPQRGSLISPCWVERKPAFLPTLLQWEIKEPCHKPRSTPQQGRLWGTQDSTVYHSNLTPARWRTAGAELRVRAGRRLT